MDLVGPLKKTRKENKFILTMTCYFSKWVEYLLYRQRYYYKQPRVIHYKGDMYLHVTDKEKHLGRRNLIMYKFLFPDDKHPSESSVNINE